MMTELVWEVGIPIIRKVTATWDVTKDLLVRRITGDVRLRPQIRVEFAVSVIFRLPAVDELPQHGNHRRQYSATAKNESLGLAYKFEPRVKGKAWCRG